MATFTIKLRNQLKDGRYNLAVRVVVCNEVDYLKVGKITKQQYNCVFIRNEMDLKSINFRNDCHKYIDKCQRIFLKCKPFNKQRFRQMFFEKEKELPHSLLLKDLFQHFTDEYEGIGIKSNEHYRTTMNVLETFQPTMTIWDITPQMLNKFKKQKKDEGRSLPTIQSYLRNLRRIINYFRREKLIPDSFPYPFGKDGGFSISNYVPEKVMLSNKEIQSIFCF